MGNGLSSSDSFINIVRGYEDLLFKRLVEGKINKDTYQRLRNRILMWKDNWNTLVRSRYGKG